MTSAQRTAKTALIVGCGDAIGSAVARRFAAGGFTVCMARRQGERLAPLERELRSAGAEAHALSLDARDEDAVVATFAQIEKEIGVLDMVLFNVGGNVQFSVLETTSRVYRKVWEMAALAGFLTGREAARVMVPRARGSIFFTGATASLRGGKGYCAFAGGKFALRALAQSLARELGPKNIHVAHLVIDGGVDTLWVRDRIRNSGRDPEALPPATLLEPASIAEAYWMLHQQPRDGWTQELDLRPWAEPW